MNALHIYFLFDCLLLSFPRNETITTRSSKAIEKSEPCGSLKSYSPNILWGRGGVSSQRPQLDLTHTKTRIQVGLRILLYTSVHFIHPTQKLNAL